MKLICGKIFLKNIFFILTLALPSFNQNFSFAENNIYPNNKMEVAEKILKITDTPYLIDANDVIQVNFLGLEFYSQNYVVNEEGYLVLPEINEFFVRGMTTKNLEKKLNEVYKEYIYEPEIKVSIYKKRDIIIFLGGEVNVRGIYKFKNKHNNEKLNPNVSNQFFKKELGIIASTNSGVIDQPTIFDALKKGKGIKSTANLSEVMVKRKNSLEQGGGEIVTKLNILSLMIDGDQSQNITLRDGDSIFVPKSSNTIREQFLSISQTNINPDVVSIFVNGNVKIPGKLQVPRGTTLREGIAAAGGTKDSTGSVNFLRFEEDGSYKKQSFKLKNINYKGSKNNPVLVDGDLIIVNKNIVGQIGVVANEIGNPILNGYAIYNLFN